MVKERLRQRSDQKSDIKCRTCNLQLFYCILHYSAHVSFCFCVGVMGASSLPKMQEENPQGAEKTLQSSADPIAQCSDQIISSRFIYSTIISSSSCSLPFTAQSLSVGLFFPKRVLQETGGGPRAGSTEELCIISFIISLSISLFLCLNPAHCLFY